jgi:ComF family protein
MRHQSCSWLTWLARQAFQNRCFLCGNFSPLEICQGCETEAQEATLEQAARCSGCASVLPEFSALTAVESVRCGQCIAHPPLYDATLTLADYSAPYDALALALKFSARLHLAGWFVRKLAHLVRYLDVQPDLIIPVPLSSARLAQRGYNQAWEIARPLARQLGIRASARTVLRTRTTLAQSELPNTRSRQRNVHAAFAMAKTHPARWSKRHNLNVTGLHIAVVDDVMTSGATLNELARQLKQAGAARITNLVALRTPLAAYD